MRRAASRVYGPGPPVAPRLPFCDSLFLFCHTALSLVIQQTRICSVPRGKETAFRYHQGGRRVLSWSFVARRRGFSLYHHHSSPKP